MVTSNCKHTYTILLQSLQWIRVGNPACGPSLSQALYYNKTSVSPETDLCSAAPDWGSGCLQRSTRAFTTHNKHSGTFLLSGLVHLLRFWAETRVQPRRPFTRQGYREETVILFWGNETWSFLRASLRAEAAGVVHWRRGGSPFSPVRRRAGFGRRLRSQQPGTCHTEQRWRQREALHPQT